MSTAVGNTRKKPLKRRRKPATAYELAKEAGLIGAGCKGPRDLSTSPAHMEGFGKSK